MRPEVLNGVGWFSRDSTGQSIRATIDHAPFELEDPVYETGVRGVPELSWEYETFEQDVTKGV